MSSDLPCDKKEVPDEGDVWTRRINALGQVLIGIAGALGPLIAALTLYYQSHTLTKIDNAKAEIKAEASNAAEKATETAKAVNTVLAGQKSVEKTTLETNATLHGWKASETKDPDDMARAEAAEDKFQKAKDDLVPLNKSKGT